MYQIFHWTCPAMVKMCIVLKRSLFDFRQALWNILQDNDSRQKTTPFSRLEARRREICGPARPHPLARALTRSYRPRGRRGFSLSSLSSVCLVVYASELYVFCPGFPLCSRVYLPPISFLDYLLSVLLVRRNYCVHNPAHIGNFLYRFPTALRVCIIRRGCYFCLRATPFLFRGKCSYVWRIVLYIILYYVYYTPIALYSTGPCFYQLLFADLGTQLLILYRR